MLGIFEKCLRCNRELKGEKSRYIGYGSHCKKIIDDERAKMQITIDELLEEDLTNGVNN